MELGIDYGQNFDNVKYPSAGPVPEGWYSTIIAKVEIRKTQKGYDRITIEHQITQGDFAKRRMWQDFDITNGNAEYANKQKAAFGKFASELHGLQIRDSAELNLLVGKQQMVHAYIEKGSGSYSDKNRIKDAKPIGEQVPFTPTNSGGAADNRAGW